MLTDSSVVVCITTYKRLDLLRSLLQSLTDQNAVDGCCWTDLIVVDNDPEGSGRAVVESLRSELSANVSYSVEDRAGVVYVRNRAISTALSLENKPDYIVFVDDDTTVAPNWLNNMVRAAETHAADVVIGGIRPVTDQPIPSWFTEAGLLDLISQPTGTPARLLHAGNSLFRSDSLPPRSEVFNPALGLTGGEDTLLGLQMSHEGKRIVWTDDAPINEYLPASRLRFEWHLKRAIRSGATFAMTERHVMGRRQAVKRSLIGVSRLGLGVAKAAATFATTRSRGKACPAFLEAALGTGMLLGSAGLVPTEYGRSGVRLRRVELTESTSSSA